jgi:maltoporin
MKSLFFFILIFSSQVFATDIKDVEMFGYARAGVGTNTFGGQQECFFNQGTGTNNFRLGNECSNYLEIATKFNAIKTDTKKAYTQFRMSNSSLGRETYESQQPDISFVEAFAEIQGMNDLPLSFWVGKRFYREQDVYMDDFYYYGNLSGNGGGVGNIDLLSGKLSFAYLRKVGDTKTNIGVQGITVYDARLKDVKLTNSLKENFWLAYGHAPESMNATSGVRYLKSNGFILGTLFDYDINGKGFNHFSVMFGQGLMNGFNLYGESLNTFGSVQTREKRLRAINHTTYNVNEKWAFHFAVEYDRHLKGSNIADQWLSAGIRPVYRVTQTFHLVTEVGHSIVQNVGERHLTRLTIAPQLSINENIWGRPVLRAFYTHSIWNDKNMAKVAEVAPTYANKTNGGSFGLQMESFF